MANIPTKRLTNLYEKALRNVGTTVQDKEFQLYISGSRDVVIMYHYGTVIYDRCVSKGKMSIGGAYSRTDRDYINGLNRLLGLNGHAFIKNYTLYYEE